MSEEQLFEIVDTLKALRLTNPNTYAVFIKLTAQLVESENERTHQSVDVYEAVDDLLT